MKDSSNSLSTPSKGHILQDQVFRRIVVVSTALAFAGTAATGAAFRMDKRMFVWHWSIPVWMIVGVIAAIYLWKFAERAQVNPTSANKRNFLIYCAGIVIVSLLGFLWPVLFVYQEKFQELSRGLITAALFLGVGGAVMVGLLRAFKDPPEKAEPQ